MDTLYGNKANNLPYRDSFSPHSIKQVPHEESPPENFALKVNSLSLMPEDFKSEIVTAYEAAKAVDGQNNLDIRPRVLDNITNTHTLLDSGSQCSVVVAGPDDIEDTSIKLESVNGDRVKCYGKTTLTVRINRKEYQKVF